MTPDLVYTMNPFMTKVKRSLSDSGAMTITNIIENEKRRASALMDELLVEIYNSMHNGTTDYNSTSGKSQRSVWVEVVDVHQKDVAELVSIINCLRAHIGRMGSALVRQLKRRDALRRQQEAHCDVITRQLAKRVAADADMRFTIHPVPGESGYSQWVAAMKMVAQLPGGIPPEFRKRLWLTLAEKHLASKGVNWQEVERNCFSEWSHPADAELGVQIVKDLHRTGCSLFCGEDGQENQALLKRVLVAYARWNKAVGYCQGFNMLAALILQVTDKCEADALKLMIYLIEGVLPDSYFADSLRGLSVDMAVFRELLRSKLPRLSRHLDSLQNAAKDGSRSYEPPLTNVFTMQWFLTLFCNCLPQPTVLRVWDLILLEGNEILLRTALGIWQTVQERILTVRSADEFYCIMGVLTREILEFGLVDANSLIKAVVTIGPLTELKNLREHYLYNINPWGPSIPQVEIDKQLKLYPKHTIALDISALKKQYTKLKQRQRQAHIIFSAAISRQPPPAAPVAMNHLLLGKSALVPSRRIGPPKGTIPPARQVPPSTLHWKDTPKQTSSSSSSDTELCDEDADKESLTDAEEVAECTERQFGQLVDDNPNADLMKTINENNSVISEVSASEITLVSSCSEISMTDSKPSDTFDTYVRKPTDSDDENFDFEQFLAERVKCLTQASSISEESGESRISYSRRNSERALQIIQENSLILHRILQCQSRLSPSPPLIPNSGSETILDDVSTSLLSASFCSGAFSLQENFKVSEYETLYQANEAVSKMDNVNCWINSQTDVSLEKTSNHIKEIESKDISPEYGAMYTGLLEKSKSLDQRYNSLILKTADAASSQIENLEHVEVFKEKVYKNENEGDVKSFPSNSRRNSKDSLKTEDNEFLSAQHKISYENCSATKTLRNSDKIINENLFLLGNIKNEKISASDLENVTDDFKISCESNLKLFDDEITTKTTNLVDLEENVLEEKYESNVSLTQLNSNGFDSKKCFIPIEDTLCNTEQPNIDKLASLESEKFKFEVDLLSEIEKLRNSEGDTKDITKDSFSCNSDKVKSIDKDSAMELKADESCGGTDNFQVTNERRNHASELIYPDEDFKILTERTIKLDNTTETLLLDLQNSKVYQHLVASPEVDEKIAFENKVESLNRIELSKGIEYAAITLEKQLSPEISPHPLISLTCDPSEKIRSPDTGSPIDFRLSRSESSGFPSGEKSPTKMFNPFPVPLNTRQNKEVPLKLGLYKK